MVRVKEAPKAKLVEAGYLFIVGFFHLNVFLVSSPFLPLCCLPHLSPPLSLPFLPLAECELSIELTFKST